MSSKNSVDLAISTLKQYSKLMNDERFIVEMLKSSQMNRQDFQFNFKQAEYMLVCYENMLARGYNSPFEVDY